MTQLLDLATNCHAATPHLSSLILDSYAARDDTRPERPVWAEVVRSFEQAPLAFVISAMHIDEDSYLESNKHIWIRPWPEIGMQAFQPTSSENEAVRFMFDWYSNPYFPYAGSLDPNNSPEGYPTE